LICRDVDRGFISCINSLDLEVYKVPYRIVMNYPVMDIEGMEWLIRWVDIVWITDVEYVIASYVKKIRDTPVVPHLRSYALLCPRWEALYRFRELCLEKRST